MYSKKQEGKAIIFSKKKFTNKKEPSLEVKPYTQHQGRHVRKRTAVCGAHDEPGGCRITKERTQ